MHQVAICASYLGVVRLGCGDWAYMQKEMRPIEEKRGWSRQSLPATVDLFL
jgi:hypothetical protein